jgi:hypothetical protein
MSNITSFFIGSFLGVVGVMLILIESGATPSFQANNLKKEAVANGYAHWELNTNNFPPTTIFKWNK